MTLQDMDNGLDRRLEQIHLAAPSSSPASSDETGTGVESSNTQIAKPPRTLVELPKEVIENILTHVFAHHDQVLIYDNDETGGPVTINGGLPTAMPKYNLGDRPNNIEDDFRMPYYTSLSTSCHLGLPAGTLNVLQTCGLLYVIGARTFYGMYEFRTTSAESFRLLFTKHIGPSNLKSIRKLSIGLPHAIKTMPTKFINGYTRMLEIQMPQLKHFEITTKFGRWYSPVTANPRSTWIENHRGLLWFSAWATRSHPVLKCAVWDEEGTVSNNKVDSERASYYDRREVVITVTLMATKPGDIETMEGPNDIEAQNDLLPTVLIDDHESEDDPEDLWTSTAHEEYAVFDEITGERINPDQVKPASRLLLDSWKIRRTGFVGLSTHETCRPYRYQLPLEAVDSEAQTPTYDAMNDDVLCEERFFHRNHRSSAQAAHELALIDDDIMVLRMRAGARLAKTLEAENAETERIMKNGPDPEPEPESEQSDAGFQTNGNTWLLPDATPGADTTGHEGNGNDAEQAPVNASTQTPFYETYVDDDDYSDDFDEENYEFDNDGWDDDKLAQCHH